MNCTSSLNVCCIYKSVLLVFCCRLSSVAYNNSQWLTHESWACSKMYDLLLVGLTHRYILSRLLTHTFHQDSKPWPFILKKNKEQTIWSNVTNNIAFQYIYMYFWNFYENLYYMDGHSWYIFTLVYKFEDKRRVNRLVPVSIVRGDTAQWLKRSNSTLRHRHKGLVCGSSYISSSSSQ